MRKVSAGIVVAAAVAAATPASAQEAWTQADEDRSTIIRFLERDDVGGAATEMGIEVQDVGRGVLQLDDAEAAQVADQVRAAEQSAASNITITTTTLIIILLVIILIAVIA